MPRPTQTPPTSQMISTSFGLPNCPARKPVVVKIPVPTMFEMTRATAEYRPNCRSSPGFAFILSHSTRREASSQDYHRQDETSGHLIRRCESQNRQSLGQVVRDLGRSRRQYLPHKESAAILHEKHAVPGWWAQSITVGYEQARGLRQVNQQASGFTANVSRTLPAAAAANDGSTSI